MAELYSKMLDRYLEDPGALEADVANDCCISDVTGYADCFKHPSVYIKWASLAADADTRYRRQKRYVEKELYSFYDAHYRNWMEESKIKVTEAKVVAHIYTDKTYNTEMEKVRTLGHITDLLKEVKNTLWQKKDLLVIVTGRYKAEERAQNPITPASSEMSRDVKDRFLFPPKKQLSIEEIEALAEANCLKSQS